MDIILHLQATLKTDIGGKPAETLSEFYIAMFGLMLQGSLANSRMKFEAVIANVWNVREAWRQVGQDSVGPGISPLAALESQPHLAGVDHSKPADGMSPARWTV
jgi:flagellar secretion chaperone FliS